MNKNADSFLDDPEQLKELVAQLQAILLAIPDNILQCSINNNKILHITGHNLNHKKINADHLLDSWPKDVIAIITEAAIRAKERNDVATVNFELLENDTLTNYECRVAPFINEEVVAILRDTTPLKQPEHKIDETERIKTTEQLAGKVAHDFNNFLMEISMSVELIKINAKQNDKILEMGDIILKTVKNAEQLTSKLLDFSSRR